MWLLEKVLQTLMQDMFVLAAELLVRMVVQQLT